MAIPSLFSKSTQAAHNWFKIITPREGGELFDSFYKNELLALWFVAALLLLFQLLFQIGQRTQIA